MAELEIRSATLRDLRFVRFVYDRARVFMAENGNPTQWKNGYPNMPGLLEDDVAAGQLYVVENEGHICGAFVLADGDDPTYAVITGGRWRFTAPYGTIHRLGSDGTAHGVFAAVVRFCEARCGCLRADTHEDNKPMQHLLEKEGFVRCGQIICEDGTPRLAYDRIPAQSYTVARIDDPDYGCEATEAPPVEDVTLTAPGLALVAHIPDAALRAQGIAEGDSVAFDAVGGLRKL